MGTSACFSANLSQGENLNEFLFVFPEFLRLSKRSCTLYRKEKLLWSKFFSGRVHPFDMIEKGCKNKLK